MQVLQIYQGELKGHLRHGNGYFKNAEMDYLGEFANDRYNGFGKMLLINGNSYEGHF